MPSQISPDPVALSPLKQQLSPDQMPKSPLEQTHHHHQQSPHPLTTESVRKPADPLPWLWRCHKCYRTYHLGATRRCLDDGHYFCAGITTTSRTRSRLRRSRVKRHEPCSSEFDFEGWENYGSWRRTQQAMQATQQGDLDAVQRKGIMTFDTEEEAEAWKNSVKNDWDAYKHVRDCSNICSYPSECRHGKLNKTDPDSDRIEYPLPAIEIRTPSSNIGREEILPLCSRPLDASLEPPSPPAEEMDVDIVMDESIQPKLPQPPLSTTINPPNTPPASSKLHPTTLRPTAIRIPHFDPSSDRFLAPLSANLHFNPPLSAASTAPSTPDYHLNLLFSPTLSCASSVPSTPGLPDQGIPELEMDDGDMLDDEVMDAKHLKPVFASETDKTDETHRDKRNQHRKVVVIGAREGNVELGGDGMDGDRFFELDGLRGE